MKSLRDALPKRPAGAGNMIEARPLTPEERNIKPEDTCQSCGYYPPGHSCCYCRDGGRVSRGDGILERCPKCSGSSYGAEEGPQEINPEEWARESRVPRKFVGSTLEGWEIGRYREAHGDGDPRPMIRSWIKSWPPPRAFLTLLGAPGTGKTHLAIAAAREVSRRYGVKVRMYRGDDLLIRYRATFNADTAIETEAQIDSELRRVPLLVLDDLTTTGGSDWATRKVLALVNLRYQEEIPTVITGNEEDLDERTHRRLLDDASAFSVRFTASPK